MVTRETPVSNQMIRSLCGCRTNRVDDKDDIVVGDYRDTVFVYTSSKVVSRSLIGALLSSLEKTNLKMVQAVMLVPSPDIVKKSSILKKIGRHTQSQKDVCLISLWRGDDSFKHVQNAVSRFCKEYAFVQGVDIALTDSTKATRKEAELWIVAPPPTPVATVPVAAVAENNIGDTALPANEQPPYVQEEILAPAAEVDQPVVVEEVQDPEDVILVRESSTADTLPVGDATDKSSTPLELPSVHVPAAQNDISASDPIP